MPNGNVGFEAWIGRQRRHRQVLDPWRVQALSAVLELGVPSPAQYLPGLWHWLYFLETATRSQIGADGHPRKGDFMPPVSNPRRMFAGARTRYHQPLLIGAPANLLETIRRIEEKPGKSGTMTIVSVAYEYSQDGKLCVDEERDFIYLPAVSPGKIAAPLENELSPLPESEWMLDLVTDPVQLMRFSALTFNSHRIHYDADYARQEEGYPALVVHGPLTAILLSELCRLRCERELAEFSFRAKSPVFVGQALRLRGEIDANNCASLTAYTPAGQAALSASAAFK
jgi:3-methylfumaryl-CoA hydratase